MIEKSSEPTDSDQSLHRPARGAYAEKSMRLLAFFILIWSLGGLGTLFLITDSQPQSFIPLKILESDSPVSRTAAIEAWRTITIPSNTHCLMRDRSPLVRYNLDPELTELPTAEHWMHAIDPRELPASFSKRLYELNVGVELFQRDYWSRVWQIMTYLIACVFASLLCMSIPRILPSLIVLVVAGLAQLEAARWIHQEPSLLWYLPILGLAFLIACLSVYRWWVVPAPAYTQQHWQKLWIGVLLTCIGVIAFIALILWGGRVPPKGLAGIGFSIGWGVYLVLVHGWKLLRSTLHKRNTLQR